MHKHLDGIAEFLSNEISQLADLIMGFVHIQILGHSEVRINMQMTEKTATHC